MAFCRECGKEFHHIPKFCSECGSEFNAKPNETEKKVEEPSIERLFKFEGVIGKPFKAGLGWVWVMLIIVVIVVVILSFEKGGVSVSSRTEKGFLSSTHEATKCGIFGCNTEKRSCPFWNRDC